MSMYTLLDHLGFPYEPPKGGVLPWARWFGWTNACLKRWTSIRAA